MSLTEYEQRVLAEIQAGLPSRRRNESRLPATDRLPDGKLRVGDEDRSRAVQRLCAGCAAGQLTLDEFDQRVAAAWRAVTRGDLDWTTVDLPAGPGRLESATTATYHPGVDDVEHPVRVTAGVLTVLVVWGLLSLGASASASALSLLTLAILPVIVMLAALERSTEPLSS